MSVIVIDCCDMVGSSGKIIVPQVLKFLQR